jgi:nitroreductase
VYNYFPNVVKKVYISLSIKAERAEMPNQQKDLRRPAMNPSLQFIFKRRSVRKFENREIPEDMFNDLFEAAMAAPSAVARDPWHFLLIRNRKLLDEIVKILPHGQMLRQAPAAVIVAATA